MVEKALLGLQVSIERFMIVEMVVREVGEDATREGETGDALLVDGMRRHLHETIFAPILHHGSKQRIETDRVGGGVGRRNLGVVYFIDK